MTSNSIFLYCSDSLCNTNICTSILSREANLIQMSIFVSFTSFHGTSKKIPRDTEKGDGRQGKRQVIKGREEGENEYHSSSSTWRLLVCVYVRACACVSFVNCWPHPQWSVLFTVSLVIDFTGSENSSNFSTAWKSPNCMSQFSLEPSKISLLAIYHDTTDLEISFWKPKL